MVVFVVDFPEKIVRKKNYFSALLRGFFVAFWRNNVIIDNKRFL